MKKRYGMYALLFGFTSPVVAGDIGHGVEDNGTSNVTSETAESTESSIEGFFDELLDVFETDEE